MSETKSPAAAADDAADDVAGDAPEFHPNDAVDAALAGDAPQPSAARPKHNLETELAESRDRELRALAEIENTRRRMRRDLDDQLKYANLPLVRDLLPVFDNLTRAIDAAAKTADATTLLEGVKMVAAQLETVFAQHHCQRIAALGQPFDPNLHKAICQQPSADQPPQTVLLDVTPGFLLHDRVVRPSEVIVATEPAGG